MQKQVLQRHKKKQQKYKYKTNKQTNTIGEIYTTALEKMSCRKHSAAHLWL